eukprot:GILI01011971.1.p1 GENE.GILI01011971.1~~GILI01011971.1.p1  ORF type:complete len:244 (-),score=67.25 GILI01011971.1:172-822(-)
MMRNFSEAQMSHYIDICFGVILGFSTFSCLIRTDFNFVFALLGYYIWTVNDKSGKKDTEGIKNYFIFMIFVFLLDLLWLIIMGTAWTTAPLSHPYYSQTSGLRGFALFTSVIVLLAKVPLLFFLFQVWKTLTPPSASPKSSFASPAPAANTSNIANTGFGRPSANPSAPLSVPLASASMGSYNANLGVTVTGGASPSASVNFGGSPPNIGLTMPRY